MSKPVVAFDAGGNRELILDKRTGILLSERSTSALAAAIRHLLRDKGQCERLGNLGRLRIEQNFSLEKMIKQTEKLYLKLIPKKAGALKTGRL